MVNYVGYAVCTYAIAHLEKYVIIYLLYLLYLVLFILLIYLSYLIYLINYVCDDHGFSDDLCMTT